MCLGGGVLYKLNNTKCDRNTACGQKCVIMAAARMFDSFLPVKFKHRKQHYFNKSAYLTFQNFVINPLCAITERIRRRMDA